MKSLICFAFILFLGACQKQSSSTGSPPAAPEAPAPPTKLQTQPQDVQVSNVTIVTDKFSLKLTNVGWCLPMPGYSCHQYDYTRFEMNGHVGYLYRDVKGQLSKASQLNMEPAVAGMEAIWNTPSTKWNQAMRKVVKDAPVHRWAHKFNFEKYERFLQIQHRFAMDRCRGEPHWAALRAYTPDKQGDLMLASDFLSYLDRHEVHARTLFELDSSGRLISVATQIDPNRTVSAIDQADDFALPNDFYEVQVGPGTVLNAINPRKTSNISAFNFECHIAYERAMNIYRRITVGDPDYETYRPFYDPKVDAKASTILTDMIRMDYPKGFPLVQRHSFSENVATQDYLNALPLLENIRPEDMNQFLKAYPHPVRRKDLL